MADAAAQRKYVLAGQLQTELESKQKELEQLKPNLEELRRELEQIKKEMEEAARQRQYVLAGQKQQEYDAKQLQLDEAISSAPPEIAISSVPFSQSPEQINLLKKQMKVIEAEISELYINMDKAKANSDFEYWAALETQLETKEKTVDDIKQKISVSPYKGQQGKDTNTNIQKGGVMGYGIVKAPESKKSVETLVNEKSELEEQIRELEKAYDQAMHEQDFAKASTTESEKEAKMQQLENVKQLLSKSPYLPGRKKKKTYQNNKASHLGAPSYMNTNISDANISTSPYAEDIKEHNNLVMSVKPETKSMARLEDYKHHLEQLVRSSVECFSQPPGTLVDVEISSSKDDSSKQNQFILAAQTAFQKKYQFVWTPDMLFLLILQGAASLMDGNPEKYQEHFDKPSFFLETEEKFQDGEGWARAFTEFSEPLKTAIGQDLIDFLIPNFTTSQFIEKAACKIALMGSVKFTCEYHPGPANGIPGFTLKGSKEDYEEVITKVEKLLKHFKMGEWLDTLKPVMAQFIKFAEKECDKQFWKNFCEFNSESGDSVTGWIQAFFPTQKGCYSWATEGKTSYVEFSSGLSAAPFTYQVSKTNHKMRFLAGFTGVSQRDAFLEPFIGWIVTKEE